MISYIQGFRWFGGVFWGGGRECFWWWPRLWRPRQRFQIDGRKSSIAFVKVFGPPQPLMYPELEAEWGHGPTQPRVLGKVGKTFRIVLSISAFRLIVVGPPMNESRFLGLFWDGSGDGSGDVLVVLWLCSGGGLGLESLGNAVRLIVVGVPTHLPRFSVLPHPLCIQNWRPSGAMAPLSLEFLAKLCRTSNAVLHFSAFSMIIVRPSM